MNAAHVILKTEKKEVEIPNRWELLSPEQFLFVVALISQYALKNATIDDVRLFYLCHCLGVDPVKITDPEAMANLIIIAEQIDFIFDESGKVNINFLAQLVPSIKVKKRRYHGYEINTQFDTLTCTLTSSQFIDAQNVLRGKADKLPLLASILYCPSPYSSEKAHELADKFRGLNPLVLQAIALNFQALFTYLFTRTHFSLLASEKGGSDIPEISTGMLETMYNLSADGMGSVSDVKQMPVIEFLTILRKKLIESVRAMHDAKIDLVKISDKTGLSTRTIKKML